MLKQLIPPFCFLLALALLIAGFTLWTLGPPEEPVVLQAARVMGDESYEQVLEDQLAHRQWRHSMLTYGCLAGSLFLFGVGFLATK